MSVGVIDGEPRLDLMYEEDVRAETDMNVVVTGTGEFVEVQGTAEGAPFRRDELDALLDLAVAGCARLAEVAARGARGVMTARCCSPPATRRSSSSCGASSADVLPDLEVVGLDDVVPYDEVPETGATFADNALIKAREGSGAPGCPRSPTTPGWPSTR